MTVEPPQSTQGNPCIAGRHELRTLGRLPVIQLFELTLLSLTKMDTHSPVTVCCVSVFVSEPGAVGMMVSPTRRDLVGMNWS